MTNTYQNYYDKKKLFNILIRWIFVHYCLISFLILPLFHCARRPKIKITPQTHSTPKSAFENTSSFLDPFSQVASTHVQKIVFGAILPFTALKTVQRAYNKSLQDAVDSLVKGKIYYKFTKYFRISNANVVLMSFDSSPTDILQNLCHHLLPNGVSIILYMTNSETYGHNIASAQYLTQLTSYLGIPMIAWNADNTERISRSSEAMILQLAPSLDHQASAILNILKRYSWHVFSIVTTSIGGHDNFVRAIRDQVLSFTDFKFNIIEILIAKSKTREDLKEELEPLSKSEARVILLHSNKFEAQEIMAAATSLELTGKNYIWIATQSVVGMTSEYYAPSEFPPGMLGIHYNSTHSRLLEEIDRAVTLIGNGLELFINDSENINKSLSHNLTCSGSKEPKWKNGDLFYKYLRKVKIKSKYGKPSLEFNMDGTLKYVELDVMNLNMAGIWEKIGAWTEQGLEIKDITWPDNSPVPPQGLPEKFNLRVTFLEEPPFVNMAPVDEETGECKSSKAVRCQYAPDAQLVGVNLTLAYRNPKYFRCCSGFCIDLLEKFANDLKFSYELSRVEDGKWGDLNNRTWNGLIAALLDHKADIVVTSIKINSDRQAYVDFTVPFLETGITIVVAKRTGIISPKAFLEPFDTISWIMILLISIQIAAFAIFLFEWLSPSGYNMGMRLPRKQKFSLFRTYWLVWAVLFGAAVPINCPKGYTARFMSNVWATFAVVFLAIYTANLAAFMITREDYHDFSGIEDSRLANPHIHDPPLRYGTLPSGNTDAVLKRHKPKMHSYMRKYSKSSLSEGVQSVKKGELDAFIYDAVVLDYLRGQDNDCRLLTVGTWYAMTGYGFAFPKNSKYLTKFNEKMIEFRENGDLERLQKFWFQGSCKLGKNKGKLSKPLDVNQFMSAFLLLGCGLLLTILLLGLEHFYFRYCRKHLSKTDKDGCFTLVSLSMAKSLTTQNSVKNYENEKTMTNEEQILKVEKEFKIAKLKVNELEAQLAFLKGNKMTKCTEKVKSMETFNQNCPCLNRQQLISNIVKQKALSCYCEELNENRSLQNNEMMKKYTESKIQTSL